MKIHLLNWLLLAFSLGHVSSIDGTNANYTPPQFWTEHWRDHSAYLTLVFSDDHIAFYFEQKEYSKKHQIWPLHFISDAWRYAKKTYGPLSPDPILYIVVHEKEQSLLISKTDSYYDEQFDNRNVLDCSQFMFGNESRFTDTIKVRVLLSISLMVLRVAKNTGNWPARRVSGWTMCEILIYDMALGMGYKSLAAKWFESRVSETFNYPKRDTYLLRDWFYPIYMHFGGSKVLNNFLTILSEKFPRRENDYERQLTLGEFIHFWSGAAREDLSVLAVPAFRWTSWEESYTLERAQEYFYNIIYTNAFAPSQWHQPEGSRREYWNDHSSELTLVYADDHTVFYFDEDMDMSLSWPFKFLSQAWRMAKETSVTMGWDPLLYVVLHGKKYDNCATRTQAMSEDRWGLKDTSRAFENLIDCGPVLGQNGSRDWNDNILNAYVLGSEISYIILREAMYKKFWRNGNESAPLQDMITLHILYSLGRNESEMNWLKEKMMTRTFVVDLNPEALAMRQWYLHIFDNFGGAKVVKEYFLLIRSYWPASVPLRTNMHLGEVVHFWSTAAKTNLWHSATKLLQWTVQDQMQFFVAQSTFPWTEYSNNFTGTNMPIPSLKWKEHWQVLKPHREELTLVYVDFYVAIYFDSDVNSFLPWPFKIISDSWRYAQKLYGPFGQDPMLYVVFHESKVEKWCAGSRQQTFSDKNYENRTVIDCTVVTGNNDNTLYLDLVMVEVAERIMRGAKATGNWPMDEMVWYPIMKILAFDIYMGIGRTNDAIRLHKDRYNWYEGFSYETWYYLIYAKFGRTLVLSRLFSLLHSYWPKSRNNYDYAMQMNYGEFAHFWSGAAGVNLTFMIEEQVKWSTEQEIEYYKATVEYSMITYRAPTKDDADTTLLTLTEDWFGHSEYLFLAYRDSFVLTYFDTDVPLNITWPFNLLSQSWSYLQKSYDLIPQTSHASLHIVFHAKRHNLCRSLWNISNKSNNVTSIIDCGRSSSESWMTESGDNVDLLMQQFGHIVQQSANQTDEKENYISSLTDVMVFDTYLSTGRIEDAHRWLLMKTTEEETQSAGEIFWIRDWYIPIYTGFGGVSVLNSYSELVYSHGSIKKDDGGKLSVGHILHFWSAAAGENLLRFASTVFSWTERYQLQFGEARKHHSGLEYSNYNHSLEDSPRENSVLTWVLTVSGVTFATFATVSLILFLLHRRRIKLLQAQIRELNFDELVEFFDGIANPAHSDGNARSESRPFNMGFEIPRDRLDIYYDQVLGSGEFGVVFRGSITTKVEDYNQITTVAVKTVKSNANLALFKSLLSELKILCYLDNKDENVARLMGAVTTNIKQRELFVALEFCEQGDLLSHLRERRSNFRDLFRTNKVLVTAFSETDLATAPVEESQQEASSTDSKTNTSCLKFLSTLELVEWARQISSGMSFISSQNIIHGDLAARNVLLTRESVAKIGDFGLSRQLANYTCYTKNSKTPLPWRWLAIESLVDKQFSTRSDIWAFGVTLYEIFTLGQSPYPGYKWNQDFVDRLEAGERVKPPHFGNEQLYRLMMDCMKQKPEERIPFEEITIHFQEMKTKLRSNSESKLDSFCIYSELEC